MSHHETFASMEKKLNKFWNKQGCCIVPAYDMEVGAGTFHPLSVFGPILLNKISFATTQPCRRPGDGMAGLSPNRFAKFHQYQVILKPFLKPVAQLLNECLKFLGFDIEKCSVDLIEGKWESPTLGAYGLGWEARIDCMEICQITYFSKLGGIDLEEPIIEYAFGLERLIMKKNKTENLHNTMFDTNMPMNNIMMMEEDFFKLYKQRKPDFRMFGLILEQTEKLLEEGLFFPGYESAVKLTHEFNCIDALGGFSINDRRNHVNKIRKIFNHICLNLKKKY